MTQYFLDSSALIKRYIVEPGTTNGWLVLVQGALQWRQQQRAER